MDWIQAMALRGWNGHVVFFLAFFLVLGSVYECTGHAVNISNIVPRRDDQGNILAAHVRLHCRSSRFGSVLEDQDLDRGIYSKSVFFLLHYLDLFCLQDGNIVQYAPGGLYYFYGMSYGLCPAQGCGSGSLTVISDRADLMAVTRCE